MRSCVVSVVIMSLGCVSSNASDMKLVYDDALKTKKAVLTRVSIGTTMKDAEMAMTEAGFQCRVFSNPDHVNCQFSKLEALGVEKVWIIRLPFDEARKITDVEVEITYRAL